MVGVKGGQQAKARSQQPKIIRQDEKKQLLKNSCLAGWCQQSAQGLRCVVWIIFMAEVIRLETSVMLLGTTKVVLASLASLP